MPLERDCREILLYSELKGMHGRLSDGSALDYPLVYGRLENKLYVSKLVTDFKTNAAYFVLFLFLFF